MLELNWFFIAELGLWFVAIGILYWLIRTRRILSVGLTLAYLFTLTRDHWVGPVMYAQPWALAYDPSAVVKGYEVTLYGVLAFVVGILLINRRSNPGVLG